MRHPVLFQVNTRVWLGERSRELGRTATFDDVTDATLDQWRDRGFDWIYLLGVWQTGEAGRRVALADPGLRAEYQRALPDFKDADVCSSCFAIKAYTTHEDFGGDAALRRLRARMTERSLRLMLDFVPNHTALDHPWVAEHEDYYVHGSEEDLRRAPKNYVRIRNAAGWTILAHGRDPYFPGWSDTLQLDYTNTRMQIALRETLVDMASRCDGVRCDMAMLPLPQVFERTWGRRPADFWPLAIRAVRERQARFVFMAECYWDLEFELQQQGFDYAYDKRLYDRLRGGDAGGVRDHLRAGIDYQRKLARFLENHDEPRAAAEFAPGQHEAAAVATFFAPGLRFFHQGQLEGRRVRIPMQLARGPNEAVNAELLAHYERLLAALRGGAVREGWWRMIEPASAWDGNGSHASFIAHLWESESRERVLAVANYAGHQAQCLLPLPCDDLRGARVRLTDLMGPAVYDRAGDELIDRGLYLDLPAWGRHVFRLEATR